MATTRKKAPASRASGKSAKKGAGKKAAAKKKSPAKKTVKKKKTKSTRTSKAPVRKTAQPKAAGAAKTAGSRSKKTATRAVSKTTGKPARKSTRAKSKARHKGKSRLTPRELRHYDALLQQRQRELTEAYLQAKGDSISDLDDGTEDYIDYAVHSYAREFLLSLTELERKQLFLVEEALERIKTKNFGNCQNCGRSLHPKRLEVAPWARYCVPCQELEERGMLPVAGESDEDETAIGEDGEEVEGTEVDGESVEDDGEVGSDVDSDGDDDDEVD